MHGQIYFYLSLLEQQKKPLTLEQINPDLLGLEQIDWEKLKTLKQWQALSYLRDSFLVNFLTILKENKLKLAARLWLFLSNPKVQNSNKLASVLQSDFQKTLFTWIQEGQNLNELPTLIAEEIFLQDVDDLFLLYGLKFLYYLSQTLDQNLPKIDLGQSQSKFEIQNNWFNSQKQILVICNSETLPLFTYLGCICVSENDLEKSVDFKSEQKIFLYLNSLAEKINQTLAKFSVDLILLVDSQLSEEYVKILKTKLQQPTISIYQVDLLENYQQSYFAKLAYQTLGIKLD